jgi:hypothetical protein
MNRMNSVAESSDLTSRRRCLVRPRLELAFTGHGSHSEGPERTITALSDREETTAADLARPVQGIGLFLSCVSAAVASEAASASLDETRPEREDALDFESVVARAIDMDIAASIEEAKQSGSAEFRKVVRLLKAWSKPSAESKRVLVSHLLEATLDPLTWQTAQDDVGPRPNVSVRLLLPSSMAGSTVDEPLRDVDIALIFRGGSRAAADLGRLADAMTPDVAIPSAAVVLQARRNAEARTSLLTEFGALTASQVAELSGSEAKNRSALAGRWRREGRLVAVEHHGTTYYPAFQFDVDGRPRPVVADVLKQLSHPSMTPWQQALWFTTANGWLDGRRPVDLLESNPTAVAAAAREALRDPVG